MPKSRTIDFLSCTQLCKFVNHVAIKLGWLATCSEFHTLSHLFDLAHTTNCPCKTIVSALENSLSISIWWGYKSTWGMIQCVFDSCHFPVMLSTSNHIDYYNRKGWYSNILRAIVTKNIHLGISVLACYKMMLGFTKILVLLVILLYHPNSKKLSYSYIPVQCYMSPRWSWGRV